MSLRGKIFVFSPIGILLTAFILPVIANPSHYSLSEDFLPSLGAGTPFIILAILSFVLFLKKDLQIESIIRRAVGVLCPYLFFVYQDFQLFNPNGHRGPLFVIPYLFYIIVLLPTLYVIGFGVTYIIQDSVAQNRKNGGIKPTNPM